MFIDTHSHLYCEEFDADRDAVVERARKAQVLRIILPDIDSSSRSNMLELCDRYPEMMYPLTGLHPTSVDGNYKKELSEVERHLGERSFYGIGECGLDFYWDKTYYKEQIKVFEWQLALAKETGLPVIIHARDSMEEILRILKKYPYLKGILHCFTGSREEAELASRMGFLLGIGGVVTFKNSSLPEIIASIRLEDIVLETDSPYLTPVPYRGKRNESSYIPLIAQKIADIRKEDIKKIEEITTENAVNLFTLPAK